MAITKERAIDILERFDFFQGQRAGRELWNEKPFEVQEEDIKNFSRDVTELKAYIADVVPKSEVDLYKRQVDELEDELATTYDKLENAKAEVERWIFENSPFEMLDIAFKRLFPNVKYTAFFEPNIRDGELGEKVCGSTDFDDEGKITIFIDTDLSINDATEIFAHELAHAGVGVEHGHDEAWEKAFDDLFNEYNRVGEEMFGSNIDAPKGESYSNALSEIDKIKRNFAREIFAEIEKEIEEALKSNYKALPQFEASDELYHNVHGKISALCGIDGFIEELKKKYTGETVNES